MRSGPETPPRSSLTPELLGAAQRAVASDELRTNRTRIRTAYTLATALSFGFGATDLVTEALWPGTTALGVALVTRVISVGLLGAITLRLRSVDVRERELDLWVDALCPIAVVEIAVLSLAMAGVDSPYLGSASLTATAYAFVPRPWTKMLRSGVAATLLLPATFALAALVWPRATVEMTPGRAWFDLATATAIFASSIFVIAAAAHLLWALRREVFAARSIGRYRVEKLIGRGGMGEVWSAFDDTLRRRVALKILRLDNPDPTALARFEREIRATTELTHPNTVRLFDFGITEDGLSYYAMELLDGESLASLLRRERKLDPARAVHLALHAARALGEAHARGIVHRDVKPENLFVTVAGGEADFVRVLDFGVALLGQSDASAAEEGASPRLTQTGVVAGTPHYLAPELIGGAQATPAADVYALGVVLYQMLSGHFPYGHLEGPAVLVAHVTEVPESLAAHGSFDEATVALVTRCLDKDPARRIADGGALAEALLALPLARAWRPARGSGPVTRPDARLDAHEKPTTPAHAGSEAAASARPARRTD